MSYILEALRKAQAERERGQVPGLDARSLADAPLPAPAGQSQLVRWVAAGFGVGLVALAGLGLWRWLAVPDRPAALPSTAAPLSPPLAPPPAPVPAAAPAVAPNVAAAAAAAAAPLPPPLPVVVSAPVVPAPVLRDSAAPMPAPMPATAASVVAANIRDVKLAQLPPELRRELPPLTVGGSMWSESRASRFVVVDGQVLREGEPATAGVTVERIAQKAVWLRWRDWRIELPL